MTPLEGNIVNLKEKAFTLQQLLNGVQSSFLNVEDPNLLLQTWNPAEDENGTIRCFLDFGGAARAVTVQTPLLHLTKAWYADAVERNEDALPVIAARSRYGPIRL